MVTKIDGRSLAKKIIAETKSNIEKRSVSPVLDVVLSSNDSSSYKYVEMKKAQAEKIGITVRVLEFDSSISKIDLIDTILSSTADGVLIQLPFYDHLIEHTAEIVNALDPKKDVDGLTATQQGYVSQLRPRSYPTAAVEAVLESLNYCFEEDLSWDSITSGAKIRSLEGKHIVIVNNTILIGKPLALVLASLNATVSIANHTTKNLTELTKQADILISATNQTHLFSEDAIKKDSILIDVTSVSRNGAVYGDFIYSEELLEKCAYYTPVPGGIGPLTIACLLRNVYKSSLKT